MRNVSDISCRENHTHSLCSMICSSKNRAVYEIMWKNMAKSDTDEEIIRRMRFACWITKATDTRSEYVIRIAFPWQQWLWERF